MALVKVTDQFKLPQEQCSDDRIMATAIQIDKSQLINDTLYT